MLRGYKPEWLYESLPYLYFCGGLLLVLATVVALGIRYRARHRPATESADVARNGARQDERDLARPVCDDGLELGHPWMDGHHRELFDRCNALAVSIRSGAAVGGIELRLYELFWAFEAHCEAEHRLFARSGDPLSDDEVDRYEALLAKAKRLRERYHAGDLSIGQLVTFIVNDVVRDHAMGGQRMRWVRRAQYRSRVSLKGMFHVKQESDVRVRRDVGAAGHGSFFCRFR